MTLSEKMVFDIVVALAAHYEARERAISDRSVSRRVRMEYVYINSRMLDAAAEIADIKYARAFICDIGRGIGYANTKIDAFSESTYKKKQNRDKKKNCRKIKSS